MKKILALVLALALFIPCFALADDVLVLDNNGTETSNTFVENWAGKWVLSAAYIGEDFADENDIDVNGIIELAIPAAITLEITADMDASATGSDAGVMVDQAAYYHAHVYDMGGTVTFVPEVCEDTVALRCPWDGWTYEVPAEGVCNYTGAVGKLSKVSGDDKTLYFAAITGIDNDAINDEAMKYVAMTEDGKFVICYSESNLTKKPGEEIAFALIFERAE